MDLWFAPNIASKDLAGLFDRPGQWSGTRSRISCLQLYRQLLTDPGDNAEHHEIVGPNALVLSSRNRRRRLGHWGLPVAIECPVIKPEPQTVRGNARATVRALDALPDVPATLSLDEPIYAGGHFRGWDHERIASELTEFASLVRAEHPDVAIGLVEPMPILGWREIVEAIDAYADATGELPAHVHVDMDWTHALRDDDAAVHERDELTHLTRELEARAVDSGLIVVGRWGDEIDTDAQYAERFRWCLDWLLEWGLHARFDRLIVQSWQGVGHQGGVGDVPRNLPEEGSDTHTSLVLEAAEWLAAASSGGVRRRKPARQAETEARV